MLKGRYTFLLFFLTTANLFSQNLKPLPEIFFENQAISQLSHSKKQEASQNQLLNYFSKSLISSETFKALFHSSQSGIKIIEHENGTLGQFYWKKKNHFNLQASLFLAPLKTDDVTFDNSNFKGITFKPVVKMEIKDLNLSFTFSSHIDSGFSLNSFKNGNYNLSNRYQYELDFDFLSLFAPARRSFSTSFFLRGDYSKNSNFTSKNETWKRSSSSLSLGFNYSNNAFLDLNLGLLVKNNEFINLNLPNPIENSSSQLHLNMDVGFIIKNVKLKLEFSPTLNQIGLQQQVIRNIVKIATNIKLW